MKDYKKYPVLISLHKAGSTWVNSFIHKLYRKIGVTLPPNNNYTEIFGDLHDPSKAFNPLNYNERIKLLEKLRLFGLEVNAKHHVPEIKSIWPWFKEFYKNHDVLVLKRRNLEGHFISQLFNDCLTKQMPYQLRQTRYEVANNYGIVAEDIMKANILEYKVEFKFDKKLFNNFCNHIRFLEDVVIPDMKPQVIYKEDINHEWLEERFRVSIDSVKVAPFKTLKYINYFSLKEQATIKSAIDDILEKEFKYYGYK